MSCLIRGPPVTERHQRRLVIVCVQGEVQSVGVVILDIVVKTVVVRNLLLYAPVGACKFPVGLGMVWPQVDQSYVEARQLVLKEGRSLGSGRLPAAALANEARSVVK